MRNKNKKPIGPGGGGRATHLISWWRAEVYVFNISGSRVEVYVFNFDKVRDHPFDIMVEGTAVCFYIDKFKGHPFDIRADGTGVYV